MDLYRDKPVFKNVGGLQAEKKKKHFQNIFDFLDWLHNLFHKSESEIHYIQKESKHPIQKESNQPLSIIKRLPSSTESWLFKLSYYKLQ